MGKKPDSTTASNTDAKAMETWLRTQLLNEELFEKTIQAKITEYLGMIDRQAAIVMLFHEIQERQQNSTNTEPVVLKDTRKIAENLKFSESGIDWSQIGASSGFITFNDEVNQYRLKILLFQGTKPAVFNDREVLTYSFKVFDELEGTEKEWNISSKRLLAQLQAFEPFIGKTFVVKSKGMGFHRFYVLSEITQ